MTEVPRMRTAPEAIAELQKIDPNTALTLRALRRMMTMGEIPVVNINSKRLINLDNLFIIFQILFRRRLQALTIQENQTYSIRRCLYEN